MKKLTRRAYNRKILMFGASIFMSIAMISTGFAAWIMSSVNDINANDVPVTVQIVEDSSAEITLDQWYTDEGKSADSWHWIDASKNAVTALNFDAPKSDNTGRVKFGGESAGEALVLPITGSISNPKALSSITIKIELPKTIYDAIKGNNEYIKISKVGSDDFVAANLKTEGSGETATYYYEHTITVPTDADNTMTFNASLTFAWGAYFAGLNPSEFYDSTTATVKRGGDNNADIKGADIPVSQMKTEMQTFILVLNPTGIKTDSITSPATYEGKINIEITGTLAGSAE